MLTQTKNKGQAVPPLTGVQGEAHVVVQQGASPGDPPMATAGSLTAVALTSKLRSRRVRRA